MINFLKNTITMFLCMIFVALPLSLFVLWLIVMWIGICTSLGGIVGAFIGVILLISIMFASLLI